MKLHTAILKRTKFDSRETSVENIFRHEQLDTKMYLETEDGLISTKLEIRGGDILLESPRLVIERRHFETAWKEDQGARWLAIMAKNIKFCPMSKNAYEQKQQCMAYCRLYDSNHEWKIAELISFKRGSRQRFYFVYDPEYTTYCQEV